MASEQNITKVGVAVTMHNCLLLVRKRGSATFILPGGKPEADENEIQTLCREINEELGCRLKMPSVEYLGRFTDVVAGSEKTLVTVILYAAELVGEPHPQSEIEDLKWFCPREDSADTLAPSLRNQIVPFLFEKGRISAA